MHWLLTQAGILAGCSTESFDRIAMYPSDWMLHYKHFFRSGLNFGASLGLVLASNPFRVRALLAVSWPRAQRR